MEKKSMNPIKVSVCVSFYNAEKFVKRCLDMLCAQSMKEGLEIVLVNDGSKDNTEELMRNYATNHPERPFVLVSQENGSLCQGRKTGINHASGEYITFLDQDDLIDASAYEKMYNCAKEYDSDIVEIMTKHGDEVLGAPFSGLQDSHLVLKHFFEKGGLQSQLWMRMYKRTLFQKSVLPDRYTNNEDMYGMPCLLHAAHSIYFIKEALHTYSVDNADSFMASMTDPKKAERRYQSRKIALGSFEHFKSFVSVDGMQEYNEEYNHFKARYIFTFLITKFPSKSMTTKMEDVFDETDIPNRKALNAFLRRWLKNDISINRLYKVLGLDITYFFYNLRKNLI